MRPLRLQMHGFGSFREETTIDFSGIDYFALVGPTGNGKSTVLDAIGFALFGKVPRHDDKTVTRNIVSLGALEARVALDFDVGRAHYTVTRVVTLGKSTPKHQVRLERLHDDGTAESLAAQVREADAAVVALLGLPFDDFTRCVVLPQGEFARFLTDEPRDRRSLLVRLLNLDVYRRLGDRARQRAQHAGSAVTALDARLSSLAGATAEAITDAEQRVAALERVAAGAAGAARTDATLTADLGAVRTQLADTEAFVARLEQIAVPAELDEAGAGLQEAAARLDSAMAALEARRAELAAATQCRAALGEAAALERRIALHDELHTLEARLVERAGEARAAADAADTAARASDSAASDRESARAQYERLRDEHRAHALRSDLHDGDQCPVCEQAVVRVPHRQAPPAIEQALAAAKATSEAAAAATKRSESARRAADAARGGLEQQESRLAELRAALGEGASRDADEAALAAVRAADAALAATRAAEQEAARAETSARRAHATVKESVECLADRFDAQRDPVAALGPPRRTDDLAASWSGLATWAGERHAEHAKRASELRATAADLEGRRQVLLHDLCTQAAAQGVTAAAGDGLAAVSQRVAQELGQAVERLGRLGADRAQAEELTGELASAQRTRQVAELLAKLLRDDAFVDWLVGAALATVVARASDTLFQLSDHQYSLRATEGSDFEIVDHANADASRSVRTLSGGETFQASLALALAMSDQIAALAANGAPRLEAIFLDEGFGSLDLDSIDTVATTIETLGTSGRMVGVVTHVRELAERIPVRFEVAKTGNCSHVTMVTT